MANNPGSRTHDKCQKRGKWEPAKQRRKETKIRNVPKLNQETKMVVRDQSKISRQKSKWWSDDQSNDINRLRGALSLSRTFSMIHEQ